MNFTCVKHKHYVEIYFYAINLCLLRIIFLFHFVSMQLQFVQNDISIS